MGLRIVLEVQGCLVSNRGHAPLHLDGSWVGLFSYRSLGVNRDSEARNPKPYLGLKISQGAGPRTSHPAPLRLRLLLLQLPDSATIDAMLLLTSGPQTCGFAAKSKKEWRVELVLFLANILHVPALVLLEGGGRGGGGGDDVHEPDTSRHALVLVVRFVTSIGVRLL